jgi:hypothetical protein
MQTRQALCLFCCKQMICGIDKVIRENLSRMGFVNLGGSFISMIEPQIYVFEV